MFLVGILLAGLSQNFTLLLAGRTIQGIGGGGIVVLTQVIICDLVPLRLRGQWFGVISGMYAIGSVSGPLLGGVFSEKVSWVSLCLPSSSIHVRSAHSKTALDILDQPSLHRRGSCHDSSIHQVGSPEELFLPQASRDRLDWLRHFHRFNDWLPYPAFVGRCLVRLGILARCGTLQR